MTDKILKKMIFIVLFIIIVIIITIIAILKNNPKDGLEYDIENIPEESDVQEVNEDFENDGLYEVTRNLNAQIQKKDMAAIDTCIRQYLDIICTQNSNYFGYNENGEYVKKITQEEINKKLYDILSEKYIEKNNITEKNAFKNINKINELYINTVVEAEKIFDDEVKIILTHVIIQSMEDYRLLQDIYIIVNYDDTNLTFSIEPISQEDGRNIIKSVEKLKKIEKNDNNSFLYSPLEDRDILIKYINIFKRLAKLNPKFIYSRLNGEFKEKRFNTFDKFNEYLGNNYENISKLVISKYQKVDTINYTKYVCLGSDGNYIYIYERAPFDFEFILDNHTINEDEFVEKYNKSNNRIKVGMNVEKSIDAIKTFDYEYFYNKLDDTFRKNNYPTLQIFEQFIKKTFAKIDTVEYLEYKEEGNLSIYKVKINNIELTIIMQLKDNTDFVMSFSI